MNYVKIGEKIRNFRKVKGLSQEQLAEIVNISVTHMSHIETGNTKLSLPVFVDIARALDVETDDLLSDTVSGRKNAIDELSELLDSCTTKEVRIITDVIKDLKITLRKYQ